MRRVAILVAATLCAAAVLAACGEGSTGSPAIRAGTRDELVLVRVVTQGGFAADASQRGELPQVSVFGDGRVVIVGPSILQIPGPALPNLQEFRVSRAGLRGILGEARYIGLLADEPPDYGDLGVTDQPTTTVTVRAGPTTKRVQVYALGFAAGGFLTGEQIKNRLLLTRFIEKIGDPDALDDFVLPDSTRRYHPTALAVIIQPSDTTGGDTHAWPLGDLAGIGVPDQPYAGARCAVFEGRELDTVLEAARSARGGDQWESAGATYNLDFRPLLPDEHDCDDLATSR